MAERSMNLDFDKIPCVTDISVPLTYQSINDMECQIAAFAWREFELGNFELCMKTLKYLQANRPQDIKVIHNICVADFYSTKCLKIMEIFCNMHAVCCQVLDDDESEIDIDDEPHCCSDVTDVDCIDDVDQCVMFYNKAVIMYHLHEYGDAIYILDKVFQFVEPLDESLGRKVCLTLLELYVAAFEPKKALGLAGYIESVLTSCNTHPVSKSNKSQDKDRENKESRMAEKLKLRLAQCKARCYAIMKTAKPCKREVKILMGSGIKAKQIAAFVLRSQLEYQRGNHRKAIKILNSAEWPDDLFKFFQETGDCLQAVYNNNLGCIMFSMEKPSLGVFYIEQGFKYLIEDVEKLKVGESGGVPSQPVHTLSLNVHRIMTYNLAMQYFKKRNYQKAFGCFIKVAEVYKNPRIWLRIAECCIQENRKQNNKRNENEELVKSVIGKGVHRKLSLKTLPDSSTRNDSEQGGPALTLMYAKVALQNALVLLQNNDTNLLHGESKNDSHTSDTHSHTVEERKNEPSPTDSLFCVVPPCNAISEGEVQDLRNAILVAISYVSLELGDLIMAHEYAVEVLSESKKVHECQRFLAHMYAGEALVAMDKISEAVEHFNSHFTMHTSLKFPSNGDYVIKCSNKQDTQSESEPDASIQLCNPYEPQSSRSIISAKLVSQYNLSLLYAMRGEWSKALRLAKEVMDNKEAPSQIRALMVYIQLNRGATDVALSYLREQRTYFKDPSYFPE